MKNMRQIMKFNDWIKDLFSAVDQVLSEWVNSYQLFSENKIEANILNFYDIVKTLWAAAAHKTCRFIKIVKNTFEFLFADEKTQFLKRDTSEFNETSINEWKRRKYKSIKDSNESSMKWDKFNICRNCFVTLNQENQSS